MSELQAGETIADRYEVVRLLGGGAQGQTFLATDTDGSPVVVKQFTIASMAGWKSLELFEREVATLRTLDHPGIPTFLDAAEDENAHYLVQEYVDGEVVKELVAEGAFDENDLRALACDVLEVLTYLHELVPPVVHRDIKPSNIIRRRSGSFAVVDFGGVQNIVATDTGGSTVVGTTGYMPSEQLIGRATPQSDLYALGATIAHLATSVHPAEMPTARLKIDWRAAGSVEVSGELSELIDEMIEPAPEDRPPSARDVLERLDASRASAVVRKTTSPAGTDSGPVETTEPERALVPLPPLSLIQRPTDPLPQHTPKRFGVARGRLHVDLSGRVSKLDGFMMATCVVCGAGLAAFVGHGIPLGFGILFAMIYFGHAIQGELELQIDRNRDFSFSGSGKTTLYGRLHGLDTDGDLQLIESDGHHVKLSELHRSERHWTAWGIQYFLEHGTLPSALEKD